MEVFMPSLDCWVSCFVGELATPVPAFCLSSSSPTFWMSRILPFCISWMPESGWPGCLTCCGDGGLESLTSLRKTVDRYLVGRALTLAFGTNGEASKLVVSFGTPLFGSAGILTTFSWFDIFDIMLLAALSDGRPSALMECSSSLSSSFTSQVSIFMCCSKCLRACSRSALLSPRVTGVLWI